MTALLDASSLRSFLVACALLIAGCAGSRSAEAPSPGVSDGAGASEAKGGLDLPPAPVGPFLDGALPPRTPNWPGSSSWDVVEAFPALELTDTLVIVPNPADD